MEKLLNKYQHIILMAALVVMAAMAVAMESLDIASLINTDSLFGYANILLGALGPVVLLGLGFALAKFIISYVQRMFSSL